MAYKNHDNVDISGEVRGETQEGYTDRGAYRFYDGTRTVWLPKSQCQWDSDTKTMEMPLWLATEKELI